ncbi:MAG: tRNA (guanosine(46)-N7)-methyltransferase TrmB [Bacillota bacterium]|nr:tRNA (guanosine(46)-N7)-methyltransferase TrmB [Bacillota bacterium]
MRQRKAKDMEARIKSCSHLLVEDPSPKAWQACFAHSGAELFLEIGCGKGQFIIKKALADPDSNYIAIEGQETVILRSLEKTMAAAGEQVKNDKIRISETKREIKNLKFACTFVEHMADLFDESQLAGIYLNFSDPWPKARHAKRRLTYRTRLRDYGWALKDGGFIEIKTDNDGLFAFTLEELEETDFEIIELTRDLHASNFDSRNVTTEYEDKFSGKGKNINYVKAIIRKNK